VVLALTFTILHEPGYSFLTFYAISLPTFVVPVIVVFLFFGRSRIDWRLYEHILKWNIVRAAVGVIVCTMMFYALQMETDLNRLENAGGFVPVSDHYEASKII
jgi:hypothetical protein